MRVMGIKVEDEKSAAQAEALSLQHSLKCFATLLNMQIEKRLVGRMHQNAQKNQLGGLTWVTWCSLCAPNPAEAKRVQVELREVLLPLTNTKKRPRLEEAEQLIDRLVGNVNRMNFKSKWTVEAADIGKIRNPAEVHPELRSLLRSPSQQKQRLMVPERETWKMTVVTSEGGTEWVTWFIPPQEHISRNVEERIYHLLIILLESGELQRLRSCPECQKFFVAEDLRREFYPDDCRIAFNNKQRLKKPGDGPNYFTRLRHQKRKQDIAGARRLLREGKSPTAVSKEVKLSLRVLRKEGVLK